MLTGRPDLNKNNLFHFHWFRHSYTGKYLLRSYSLKSRSAEISMDFLKNSNQIFIILQVLRRACNEWRIPSSRLSVWAHSSQDTSSGSELRTGKTNPQPPAPTAISSTQRSIHIYSQQQHFPTNCDFFQHNTPEQSLDIHWTIKDMAHLQFAARIPRVSSACALVTPPNDRSTMNAVILKIRKESYNYSLNSKIQ